MKPVIKSVFFFPNGNVAVCDTNGDQVSELQGPKHFVIDAIRAAGYEVAPELEIRAHPTDLVSVTMYDKKITRRKVNELRVRIGIVQAALLSDLRDFGHWWPRCGWTWSGDRACERRLRRLVELGLVDVKDEQVDVGLPSFHWRPVFTINDVGREALRRYQGGRDE